MDYHERMIEVHNNMQTVDFDDRSYLIKYLAEAISIAMQIKRGVTSMTESNWCRSAFGSVWIGPEIELFIIQNSGSDESWSWTARGWRQPDDDWGADKWGWVNTTTREAAENAALRFYLQKDQ